MRRIAIAPGDPAGIGYEITAKALKELQESGVFNHVAPVIYAQAALMKAAFARFAPCQTCDIEQASQAAPSGDIFLIDVDAAYDTAAFEPGRATPENALCAHRALMCIGEDVKARVIEGICTGPIHKGAMRLAHVEEIGHTEMLAKAFGVNHPLTLFITRSLRIFFYSRHLSLRQAIDALDEARLFDFVSDVHTHMHALGFSHPKLAMAALNPHGSDGGQFGTEEAQILTPAAQRLRQAGIDISDPIGADSVFAFAAKGAFDAVISLYHDQGHIAAKTYDFERTISATLGLPVLRTSVDHGTAFDIAWQGTAQHLSMTTAVEALLQYGGSCVAF